MYTYQTSVYNTSVVFPWLTESSSSSEIQVTEYSTSNSYSFRETFDGDPPRTNSDSGSGSSVGRSSYSTFTNYQKFFSAGDPAKSGYTSASKTFSQVEFSQNAGQLQFAPPLFQLGQYQARGGATRQGETSDYIETISVVLGSNGYSYETYIDNYTSASTLATGSGAFSYASGGVGTNTYYGGQTLISVSSEYKKRIEYQQAETIISNEYFSASTYIAQNISTIESSQGSLASTFITTEYRTVESTSYFTSQTGSEPSQTATTSETYEGRFRYEIPYTLTITDEFNYYKTSTSTTSTLYFLSHSYVISGTSSYVTITESSSTFSALTTNTVSNPARPMLTTSNTTDYYKPLGMEATVLKSVGNNWANGDVGGYLVKNGNNQNIVQAFSDFSIIVSDNTILPALSMGVYTSTKPYNTRDDSFTFGRLATNTVEEQLTLLFNKSFINTEYYFQNSIGRITSSTYVQFGFFDTYSTLATLFSTATIEGVCPPGSQTYSYVGTLPCDKTTSSLFVYGSNKNLLTTHHGVIQSTITAELVFAENALDYLYTTIINAPSTFKTNRDGGHTFERQSFNTATAKSFYHVGNIDVVTIVGKGHGQYQIGNIYLHTSVSNKTDNTGYFMFSNNVSINAVPVILTYNANGFITNNNQLRARQEYADALYEYANFGGEVDDEGEGREHYTPISQSSYSFEDYREYTDATIGRHTVSFGGPQDSGSFTRITSFTDSSNTQFSTTSGTISYLFAESAGTGLELVPLYNDPFATPPLRGIGGVRNLYTAVESLYINTRSIQFVASLRGSEITVGRPISYTFINYSTDTSTGSYSITEGSIGVGSSIVQGLKYISVNGDSWLVVDNILGTFLSAVELPNPYWNSTSVNNGILAPYANLTSYYGDTYWQY